MKSSTGRKRKEIATPGERKQAWVRKTLPKVQWTNAQTVITKPPWREFTDAEEAVNTEIRQRRRKQEKEIDKSLSR